MTRGHTVGGLVALAILCLVSPALGAIQLTQVASGLSSPLFVGHAGDGSQRLFIEERGGIIRVMEPGKAPTIFLDIHDRVVAGGEQGLLGLAFHPQYALNRRFFVFYTRPVAGDAGSTLVIAEYGASSADPNVADRTETVLLTIPHPTNTNHNGGMLAFGFDGYLYIGVGDGGSGNDPPNNAQNIDVLLGKILRIDVDNPDPVAQTNYSSPPDNPFVGVAGRDEIFAFGLRNPWRFSFDRSTHLQWVGDVGQGAREEVDTPIVRGANYGWRVYEGLNCTNNDPTLCNPANYTFPIFDYSHVGGRCSLTGGYVYRGSLGTLPAGTYVYGDYCSGEIFVWDGTAPAPTLLLDTALNISSFGEDEQGELYVVALGGTVSKIVSTAPPCTYSLAPTSQTIDAAGGIGSFGVAAGAGCQWTAVPAVSWVRVTSGSSGSGDGTVNYSVDANTVSSSRAGTIPVADKVFTVNQGGAAPCTYSISPTRATFGAAAGSGSVTVTAGQGCNWTAASNASWVTITAGATGSSNGTVRYSVAPYTGKPRNRNGTMTIAGITFSVKQSR